MLDLQALCAAQKVAYNDGAFRQATVACLFQNGNMKKCIRHVIARLNESKTLGCIKPLNASR